MPGPLEKTLPCKLSREEIEQRSQEMAGMIQEKETKEEIEKSRKKAAKKELDEMDEDISKTAEEVSTGITRREVQCEERRNNDAGTMEVIRLDDEACWPDGKQLVTSRPLKPAENQLTMLDDHRHDRDDDAEGEDEEGQQFDAEAALE